MIIIPIQTFRKRLQGLEQDIKYTMGEKGKNGTLRIDNNISINKTN